MSLPLHFICGGEVWYENKRFFQVQSGGGRDWSLMCTSGGFLWLKFQKASAPGPQCCSLATLGPISNLHLCVFQFVKFFDFLQAFCLHFCRLNLRDRDGGTCQLFSTPRFSPIHKNSILSSPGSFIVCIFCLSLATLDEAGEKEIIDVLF